MHFVQTLLNWYEQHKRDLPWRAEPDPYRIWLSEVILQQTRVDQGLDYYYRFCTHFPTVTDLADASEEEVLKLWQGLGYYSRARNLHYTARQIAVEFKGEFPDTYSQLLSLKGIGPYTAAAIASMAFNRQHAVVDGNVYRVLSRYFGIDDPIDESKGKKHFAELAESLIPSANPGTWNQALMEFGALFCVPRNPDCAACPLHLSCEARKSNRVHALPVKARKTLVKNKQIWYLIIRCGDQILVHHRANQGIWKNLWDFPHCESVETEIVFQTAMQSIAEQFDLGAIELKGLKETAVLDHVLSHRKLQVHFMEASTDKVFQLAHPNLKWVNSSGLAALPVPRLIDKYLNRD